VFSEEGSGKGIQPISINFASFAQSLRTLRFCILIKRNTNHPGPAGHPSFPLRSRRGDASSFLHHFIT
jgi:hypothetical protein